MLRYVLSQAVRCRVTLKGAGRFFCLYCEQAREYELREWSRTLVARPENRWREFVLCCECESPFSVECLDESCVGSFEELLVSPPNRAVYTKLRDVPWRSSEYDDAPSSRLRADGSEVLVGGPRPNTMIAYSVGRRH